MTVSKTVLLQQRFSRMGTLFINVTGNSSIPTSDEFVSMGQPFSGAASEITPPVYPVIAFNISNGAPFKDTVGNVYVNASEFDYVRLGRPYYGAPQTAGPTYNTAQFFMVF